MVLFEPALRKYLDNLYRQSLEIRTIRHQYESLVSTDPGRAELVAREGLLLIWLFQQPAEIDSQFEPYLRVADPGIGGAGGAPPIVVTPNVAVAAATVPPLQEVRLIHSAEAWQFWAFVFAAMVTLAFAVVDEVGSPRLTASRITLKVIIFGLLAVLTYLARVWLGRLLTRIKTDRVYP